MLENLADKWRLRLLSRWIGAGALKQEILNKIRVRKSRTSRYYKAKIRSHQRRRDEAAAKNEGYEGFVEENQINMKG